MKYRILHRTIFGLAVLLLVVGCTKELPAGEEFSEGEKYTRIVFSPSGFTESSGEVILLLIYFMLRGTVR